MAILASSLASLTLTPLSLAPRSSACSHGVAATMSPLRIECSSHAQKKSTAHHNKSRPKKRNPYDKNRRGPTVYARLPKPPPIWGFDTSDLDQAEAAAAAPEETSAAGGGGRGLKLIVGRVMANDEGASPSVFVDDSGRLRVLDPETNSHSRLVAQSCTVFQSKLQHFQNLVKQLLDQAGEKAQQIEDAKLAAVGMRNMVSAEIETRPEKLRDQRSLIADKQEQLKRLHAEYESLLMVKQEQEVLIARLSDSSLQV